jgi:hypothetical protein
LPPASAGGQVLSKPALAEIKKDAAINKALAKALRNYAFFFFRLKPIPMAPTSG